MGPVVRYETDILQVTEEIDGFCALLQANGASTYLEIGSKFGGSLWRVANALPKGSRIVSVDLPNGTRVWKESSASLVACVAKLNEIGYDARILWGDSTDPEIVRKCRKYGPYHAIMLDGDHRLAGVTADWNNYGQLGNIIAFHDISWRRPPDWVGVRIDVPEFWNSIKGQFRHQEFKFCPKGKDNGIGVLWRD
jgi:cephalosporin hydroxylase